MKEQIKQDIIDTLSYFDIFNYPLTLDQLHFFLHYNYSSKKLLGECVDEIHIIEKKYGYYFFSGRESCAIKRKANLRENKKKRGLGAHYSRLLGMVPGVRFVALTGSTAMNNASEDDDIDLFIITRKNMLWITRPMVILLTKLLKVKREYKSKKNKDKLCLNMFLDESELEFSEKNIYIAHEIVQMNIYYEAYDILSKIHEKNLWIKKYFPSLGVKKNNKANKQKQSKNKIFEKILKNINTIAFIFQYIYMSSKITKEQISLQKAFFHPSSSNKFILNEYEKRRKVYLDLYRAYFNYEDIKKNDNFNKKAELIN